MQLEGKQKNKNKIVGCVGFKFIKFFWEESLEIFYNRLLVWIEFNFVINYC